MIKLLFISMVHLLETNQTCKRMSTARRSKKESPVVISFMDFVKADVIPKRSNSAVSNEILPANKTEIKKKQYFQQTVQTGKRKRTNAATDSKTTSKRKKSDDGEVVYIDKYIAPKKVKTGKQLLKSTQVLKTVSKKVKKTKHRRSSSDVIEIKVIKPPQFQKDVAKTRSSVGAESLPCETHQEETPLWAEKHKPKSPADLLVNQSTVIKLQRWLKEWKEVIEKESVSLQKQAERQQNKKKKKSSGSSSDSDFRLSDEDSRGHGLCNTFVLVGPTGCGKTVTAYTCANELGFKVLEINASCQRSYKQVMAQLQEATQSHLVLKQSNKDTPSTKTNLVKTATCKGMEGFFKKQTSKSTSLPSTKDQNSLILFDEVEAILENDKGFWSAVQSFSSISKRPILLTTTKESALQNLTGNYIAAHVPAASKEKLCSLLHEVASNEGSTLDASDCDEAVSSMKCDIRHSFMSLHFWTQAPKEKSKSKSIKPKQRSRSNSSLQNVSLSGKMPISRLTSKCWGLEDILKSTKNLGDSLSQIHEDSLKSLEDSVSHMIKHDLSDVLFQSRFNLIGAQVTDHVNSSLTIHVPKDSPPAFFGDNNQSHPDIDADFLSLAYNRPLMPSSNSMTYSCNGDSTASITSDGIPISSMCSEPEPNLPIANSSFSTAFLNDLSKYFENFSLCDRLSHIYAKTYPQASKCSGHAKLYDGLSDDIVTKVLDPPSSVASTFADYQASLRVRNLRNTQLIIQHQQTGVKSPTDLRDFRTRYSDSLFDRLSYCNDSKASATSCRPFHLDYLPALRFVCRMEEKRKAAKISRRFFHYLDQIQLFPSPGDVSKLSSEFVERVIDEKS